MRNVLVFAVLAALAWFGYAKYQAQRESHARAGFTTDQLKPRRSLPDSAATDARVARR